MVIVTIIVHIFFWITHKSSLLLLDIEKEIDPASGCLFISDSDYYIKIENWLVIVMMIVPISQKYQTRVHYYY